MRYFGAALLVIFALVLWRWLMIPPTPDPNTIPSHVIDPPSEAYLEVVKEARSVTRQLISEEKLPGLSLAVAVGGEIVWSEGFRWANMDLEEGVTPETRFRIGGITQTFTAAAVGLLAERGQLDLDAPLRRYVPLFPEKKRPLSLRRLMSHTAGVRPHRGEGGFLRGTCKDDSDRMAIFSADSLVYLPGTKVHYSTYGWVLVGAAVAAAAGEPYADFVHRELFSPLGMEQTVLAVADRSDAADATFYYPSLMLNPRYGLQNSPEVDFSCYEAAVGFLSTPSDLVRFGSAMMSGALLSRETAETLWTPAALESGEETEQALGWTVLRLPIEDDGEPVRIAGHGLGKAVRRYTLGVETVGGQVAGSTATLLLVPAHETAVAVASNVSGAENVSRLAVRLAEMFGSNTPPNSP